MIDTSKKIHDDLTVGYYNHPTEHLCLSTPDAEIYLWPEEWEKVLEFVHSIPKPNGFRLAWDF